MNLQLPVGNPSHGYLAVNTYITSPESVRLTNNVSCSSWTSILAIALCSAVALMLSPCRGQSTLTGSRRAGACSYIDPATKL
jgi:hypothetical protein